MSEKDEKIASLEAEIERLKKHVSDHTDVIIKWKARAEKAEARAERYAAIIREVEEWDGSGRCHFCEQSIEYWSAINQKYVDQGHAADCIKQEVDNLQK